MRNTHPEFTGGNQLIDAWGLLAHLGIHEGARVGELGCGAAGHYVLPASTLAGKNGIIYAVDIQKVVLESIKSKARLLRLENIQTVWSNLEQYGATDILEGSLNVAMLINVLFQSDKHDAILKEALRLLMPQGKLLIVDWVVSDAPLGPPLPRRVPAERVRYLAGKLGLVELEYFNAGPYHYGLVYQKP